MYILHISRESIMKSNLSKIYKRLHHFKSDFTSDNHFDNKPSNSKPLGLEITNMGL